MEINVIEISRNNKYVTKIGVFSLIIAGTIVAIGLYESDANN